MSMMIRLMTFLFVFAVMAFAADLSDRPESAIPTPAEEVRKFLKEDDKALIRTSDGFRIKRKGREDIIYRGEIKSLHCLRDEYILEVFVNGGEEVYTALL